ncbi:MAG: hypothetical protein Q9M13_08580 [Mariprofundales bacterium]|nr:hypothetical protein [Mariprofundales bacterium]
MAEFIEASVMFQNGDVAKMYLVIAVVLFGLAALNYASACSDKDPIE